MSIDYNKFLSKGATYTPARLNFKIDYNKFVKSPTQPLQTRTVTLPGFLGGGEYKTAGPGTLIKTTRSYADLPTKEQEERDHIISVALGGTSSKENLQYLKTTEAGRQEGKVSVEQKAINDYLDGKISLPEARLMVQAKLQEILMEKKGIKKETSIWEGIKDFVKHPIKKSAEDIIEIHPQTKEAAKELKESLGATLLLTDKPVIKNTIIDYAKVIHESWDNAVEKIAEAAIVERGEAKSKKVGKTLEAWTAMAGLAFSPITAAFSASKNLPIIGGMASIINLPLAFTGDTLTNLSNLGLDALVATNKIKSETAENIRQGVNEVASLAGQMVVAGKIFGKIRRAEVKKELTKKYGGKDAETILNTAETRAKIELQAKPEIKLTEKPKIDYNKFVPKKEAPLAQEAKQFKSAEEFVEAQRNKVDIGIKNSISSIPEVKNFDGYNLVLKDNSTAKISAGLNKAGELEIGWLGVPEKFQGRGIATKIVENIQEFSNQSGIRIRVKDSLDNKFWSKFGLTKEFPADFVDKTKSQLTDIWEKATKREAKPIEYKPIEEIRTEPTGTKEAGIARSIEAKAIERGLIKDGVADLSTFEGTTIEAQARAVKEMIKSDFERTRAVVRGEEALPEGVRGISVVKGMEEIIKKTKDINEAAELARELANSPLAAKVSEAAQELSLTRGRELDSASAKMQQVKKAREKKAEKDLGKKKEIKNQAKKETEKNNLLKEDLSWEKFIKEIEC